MKVILIFVLTSLLFTQTPAEKRQQAGALYEKMNEQLKTDQFSEAIETLNVINTLRKGYSDNFYYMAFAHAKLGNTEKAYNYLALLAQRGHAYRAAFLDTEPLNSLSETQIRELKNAFKVNYNPISSAKMAFQLERKGLITESVLKDPDGNFYISSVRNGLILKRNSAGEESVFFANAKGVGAIFSLKLSNDGKFLWASTSQTKEFIAYKKAPKNSAGLLCIDLKTGKLVETHYLGKTAAEPILGDFVIAKNGDIYISDSVNNTVYRLKVGSSQFETLIAPNYFSSLQGLALDATEANLFLADYSTGIFKLNLESLDVSEINVPLAIVARGVDGLYFYKNTLVATQNGFQPNRVIQFALNKAQTGIDKQTILEANNPLLDDPTLGFLSGNTFYFIANSQWSSIQKDGSQTTSDKLEKSTILVLEL